MNPLFALIGGMVLAYGLFAPKGEKEKNERDPEQRHAQERGSVVGGDGGGLPHPIPAHEHHRGLDPEPSPVPSPKQPPVAAPIPSHPVSSGAATDQLPELPGENDDENAA